MYEVSNKKEMSLIAQGSIKFGLDLYNRLTKPGENAVFSSYSVSSVLSMASMGAKGSTLQEMREALHLPEDVTQLQKAYSSFTALLDSKENSSVTLETAHGLFPSNKTKVHENYVQDVLKYFSSDVQSIDYINTQAASNHLNEWVSSKTHDNIKDLFSKESIDPDTAAVLIDAIYFKGTWLDKFDPVMTRDAAFHVSPETLVQAPTMFAEMDIETCYSEDLKCDIFALPYKGNRLSMIIFLPKERFGLEELENKLLSKTVFPLNDLSTSKVEVYLPKFKIETKHDIKDALQKQGVRDLFLRGTCDVSGIAGEPKELFVSEVVQKAMIEVNEEGTEAAAATMMQITPCCLVFRDKLVVDHPFAFMIRDNLTELIIFNGRIINPVAK
uniref:Leukocyte elastase inhibitor C n=1 Tax=Caligus rogercresseyi TaxID=217165 RepID=C1BN19_CALRO|nr:Leukocyte elastase inhibitor C [Caligus rogercresseyi]